MKIVRIIFAVYIGILTLTSCSSDEIKLPFDFGEGDFEEPFVGLLKSKPEVLVKSLDYFPFSLLSPDTLTFENEYEVVVNKECLRSRSSVTLQFRDTLYNPVDGVDFYVNGKLANNGDISFPLDSLAKTLSVKMMLSPSLGDTTLVGNIYVLGDELDEVDVQSANGYGYASVTLQYSPVKLSSWYCHQELGWPIILWLLWLLTALVCLAIFIFVAYLAIRLVLMIIALIFGAIRSAFESVGDAIDDLKDKFAGREWRKNTTKRAEQREEKKEEEKKDDEEDPLKMLYRDYPEVKTMVKSICNKSPSYFEERNIQVVRFGYRNYNVCWTFGGVNSKTCMHIHGNVIEANAGSLPGNGAYDGQLNEFLNFPLSNMTYKVDGCFIYTTDYMARTISATADISKAVRTLHRRQKDRSSEYKNWVRDMDGKLDDDGGHLIATRFNGPAERINIVPMTSSFQRNGVWANEFERNMANAVNSVKSVSTKIELSYSASSRRPWKLSTTTYIDGRLMHKSYQNKA
ncbi:MAG TPA: DNA/RNA non-specific endonuclease [Candidatus Avibacteroides avistercoris]|uniref:DNA/RNA non-specific endonuclease n=1 Tax=Candidatus Avibacteroides avistercoris TaxID=2840690 RepID=A0A9D2ZV51_9BACT|nr:DNA/RNA non-specific endonuclease [Candidatus Avibacteroides avistercoris]